MKHLSGMLRGRGRPLTYLEHILLFILGISSGLLAAAGIFAFIVMIGIFTRLASRTRTSSYTSLYENMIILGGSLGNVLIIYGLHIPLFITGTIVFGLFSGIFVGCLAMALAEVLNVFPILIKRAGIVCGLPVIILCVAIGKAVGALLQFYVF